MIGRLRGVLLEKKAPDLVVEVNGVSYELLMPLNSFHRLPEVGEPVTVATHLVVREDGHFLYGFVDVEQRSLFRSLIKVNGVGPKLALAIISSIEPDVFVRYVLNNDTSNLSRIPGIGKKTAQRLVIEMRDKVAGLGIQETLQSAQSNSALQDAESALVALGYKSQEAKKALARHQQANISSEELIRLALREIK